MIDDDEKIYHERRHSAQPVQDRPTETGIKINNIISFLILSVMAWVGYNIEDIKKNVSTTITITAINKTDIKHLQEDLAEHKRNHNLK